MALQSPGVEVTVIDESFYTPADAGTTPLIVVATAQDKRNGAGTGTAPATTKVNAGKAFKITSQRDLTEFFGVPFFEKTASSTPIHGSERNEYGLLTAYSFLGVSNAAFIVRADVDLTELQAQTDAPGALPSNGQWWVDTQTTAWGIQEWDGSAAGAGSQKFLARTPLVLTDSDATKIDNGAPKSSVGSIGDYAVVFQTVSGSGEFKAENEQTTMWYKSAGNGTNVLAGEWVLVGSKEWQASHPIVIVASMPTVEGELYVTAGSTSSLIDRTSFTTMAQSINSIAGLAAQIVGSRLFIYSDGTSNVDDSVSPLGAIQLEGNAWPSTSPAGLYYPISLQQSPHTIVPTFKRSQNSMTVGGYPSGSVWIKTTEPNNGARWRVKQWSSATTSWVSFDAPIYDTTTSAIFFLDKANGGAGIAVNSLFTQSDADEDFTANAPSTAKFRLWKRVISAKTATSIESKVFTDTMFADSETDKTFIIKESVLNSLTLSSVEVSFETADGIGRGNINAERISAAINASSLVNIEASVVQVTASTFKISIKHKLGGDFKIDDTDGVFAIILNGKYNIETGTGTANLFETSNGELLITGWQPLASDNFSASGDAPLNEPIDGQLWYTPNFSEVDLMIHNGNTWVGYRNGSSPFALRDSDINNENDPTEQLGYLPIVSASNPYVAQSSSSNSRSTRDGDIWVSTADLENYPTIYRYNSLLENVNDPAQKWELVDKADQTTEEGVLFADARYNVSGGTSNVAGSLIDLASSNFLDFDAPDPALYPRGMLLWNLRRSGGNVKRYATNYINTSADNARYDADKSESGQVYGAGESQASYKTDRWVTASPNNEDGAGSFGRKAQRGVVVSAMKSVIDTSQEIRDEERRNFNLISAPGYPELMSNLVNLNIDRGVTAFIIGDTPLRLPSDATSLTTWGTNANLVTDNGDDGVVTYDEYLATYYPNGFTTDLSGAGVVVPASHMMLKTFALSDNVSYPWFAPAGTRRGGITNATAVGYIDSASGEFQTVALNEGQRDSLYDLKINPIPFFNGVGLVAYGQKTRARNASALDRINVARLVVYLRSQLNRLARPYIFEPNDKITRDEIKQACDSLMLELVGLRALYDFAVVCDESNNTPSRIDRNELYVDIAIQPVKAVEFIYIPLRVQNTGEF